MLSYENILGCFVADVAAIFVEFSVVFNGIFVVPPAALLNFSSISFAQVQLLSRQNVLFFNVVTLGGAQAFMVIEIDILVGGRLANVRITIDFAVMANKC